MIAASHFGTVLCEGRSTTQSKSGLGGLAIQGSGGMPAFQQRGTKFEGLRRGKDLTPAQQHPSIRQEFEVRRLIPFEFYD